MGRHRAQDQVLHGEPREPAQGVEPNVAQHQRAPHRRLERLHSTVCVRRDFDVRVYG